MKSVIGYAIAIIGLIIMAISFLPINIPGIEGLGQNMIIIAGIIAVIFGVLIAKTGTSTKTKQENEVPIYEGKKIVGYRRHKK